MRIESTLCHISENKAVVKVNGWLNDKIVGSALAEGNTVEIAEDRAISRLYKRINTLNKDEETKNLMLNDYRKNNKNFKVESPKNENINLNNDIEVPIDWSNELAEIDSEIKRLKWTRDDEVKFLEKHFGYNNRTKITSYKEIIKYLNILKNIDNNLRKNMNSGKLYTLIEESDNILNELHWDHNQGREFLHKEFKVSTRKELNEKQLVSFIEKLKSIRNQKFYK